jgi:hypothetical protein
MRGREIVNSMWGILTELGYAFAIMIAAAIVCVIFSCKA